ncbi:uncharacterized protein LOC124928597 isoform X1 [Impatiens glandulifera]|uniref:uncharacterized protein LOC124928597 isoform X1 n=1 Tax=Impatiens glandulifera TaxID=253017 RepID=UPI001FB0E843|nr:uncharacterized protein LOC124928597 isoform X1 [Impatiens glandulifera]XP_047324793.1 uncharacterized protein LOC124928597 isoform X1 [Impatiens glandulifera]XP_047324794.1 uncharacterized protein LOC124928597 isoform X1 [Impatiens glandulifera]
MKRGRMLDRRNIYTYHLLCMPTPIPDCTSDPSSPSPYIVNHKRRGGKVFSLCSDGSDEKKLKTKNDAVNVLEESFDQEFLGQEVIVLERNEVYAIEDELFDSRCEQVGTSSCSEVDDCGRKIDNQSLVSYQGEFFDAIEGEIVFLRLLCLLGQSIVSARMESGSGNGDSEVQRTMLELLNQLDGFEASNKIKVLMATNCIDILDEALLRPGRELTGNLSSLIPMKI